MRFCSPACRQKAYRERKKGGGPAARPEVPAGDRVVYLLEERDGWLHYRSVPMIALAELPKPWQGHGNRHVSAWPLQATWKLQEVRKELGERDYRNAHGHLFECLECRRWSVGKAWVFCSHRCRRAYRALQARERRLAAQ